MQPTTTKSVPGSSVSPKQQPGQTVPAPQPLPPELLRQVSGGAPRPMW
ncbi:MAG: hypothetical protein KF892_16555 [Rhizobacter sp.]|jgi:hypothetical protein|nr:hypothetical protein [Rhizobacter sp.]